MGKSSAIYLVMCMALWFYIEKLIDVTQLYKSSIVVWVGEYVSIRM